VDTQEFFSYANKGKLAKPLQAEPRSGFRRLRGTLLAASQVLPPPVGSRRQK